MSACQRAQLSELMMIPQSPPSCGTHLYTGASEHVSLVLAFSVSLFPSLCLSLSFSLSPSLSLPPCLSVSVSASISLLLYLSFNVSLFCTLSVFVSLLFPFLLFCFSLYLPGICPFIWKHNTFFIFSPQLLNEEVTVNAKKSRKSLIKIIWLLGNLIIILTRVDSDCILFP